MIHLNRERGITIVLVTHEPHIAVHSQRTVHLRDGLIVGEDYHEHHRERSHCPA